MTAQQMQPEGVHSGHQARYDLEPESIRVVWEGLREALPDLLRTLYAWFRNPSPRQRKTIVLNPSFSGTVVGQFSVDLKVEKRPRTGTVADALRASGQARSRDWGCEAQQLTSRRDSH